MVFRVNDISAETAAGDVRDFLLNYLKFEQEKDRRPWNERNENEQREMIARARTAANDLVRKCVVLAAAAEMPALVGTLEAVAIKDGLKATVKFSRSDERRHDLVDAQGKQVVIVVADPREFLETRGDYAVKLDQPSLPIDLETGEIGDPEDAEDDAEETAAATNDSQGEGAPAAAEAASDAGQQGASDPGNALPPAPTKGKEKAAKPSSDVTFDNSMLKD